MAERSTYASTTQLLSIEWAEPLGTERVTKEEEILSAPHRPRLGRFAWTALVVVLVAGMFGWLRWQQSWKDLESRLPQNQVSAKQRPLSVPASLMDGMVTHRVEAAFPEEARQKHVHGTVLLDVVIGRDGTVVDLRPVSGPDLLVAAAVDSVKWWRYEPYRVDGQPTEIATTVVVNFPGD